MGILKCFCFCLLNMLLWTFIYKFLLWTNGFNSLEYLCGRIEVIWFKFLNNFPLVFQNAYINLCSSQKIHEDSTFPIVSPGLVLLFFFLNHPRVIFDSYLIMLVIFKNRSFYFACECLTCMSACAPHAAWCLWRSEDGVRSLELELQVVVSHHVGGGN